MAFASSRVTIRQRRSSPNFSAHSLISLMSRNFNASSEPRYPLSIRCSVCSLLCSFLSSSRRARRRSLVSRIYSAWASVRRNLSIRTGFGSSSVLTILITSSRLSRAINIPSSRCSLCSILARRVLILRITVNFLKSSHSSRTPLRERIFGLLSSAMIFIITGNFSSSWVLAHRCSISWWISIRLDFGSITILHG